MFSVGCNYHNNTYGTDIFDKQLFVKTFEQFKQNLLHEVE